MLDQFGGYTCPSCGGYRGRHTSSCTVPKTKQGCQLLEPTPQLESYLQLDTTPATKG